VDFRARTERLLEQADIRIDGDRPQDMQVHEPRLYRRIFAEGSLGFGEAYIEGWWDCQRLDEFFYQVFRLPQIEDIERINTARLRWLSRLTDMQSLRRAVQVGEKHYDAGNDLFAKMLDRNMIYSCGYWSSAADLDAAQLAKLDLVAKKIDLKPGMRVLDIGCGWGGAARHFAREYGVEVVGITISREQAAWARQWCEGLPVEVRIQDYRLIEGRFDAIYSIGMFEHVGYKSYRAYFEVARRCLSDQGLFLLHTIGNNITTTHTDPWIHKYIFPNGMLPSAAQISSACEGLFVMEDWHNFGPDYDRTLMCWYENFERAYPELAAAYPQDFRRMWHYYLLSCAATFRARRAQLWQVLLAPPTRTAAAPVVR